MPLFIKDEKERPRRCFVCIGMAISLPLNDPRIEELIHEFYTSGGLTKHFKRRHLSKYKEGSSECKVRRMTLVDFKCFAPRNPHPSPQTLRTYVIMVPLCPHTLCRSFRKICFAIHMPECLVSYVVSSAVAASPHYADSAHMPTICQFSGKDRPIAALFLDGRGHRETRRMKIVLRVWVE